MARLRVGLLFFAFTGCVEQPMQTDRDSGHADAAVISDAGGYDDAGCRIGSSCEACDAVKNSSFGSQLQGECGLGPSGVIYCTWRISFSEGNQWVWRHSDTEETGTYTCDGLSIAAAGIGPFAASRSHSAAYDPTRDQIIWDGVARYSRQ